MLSELGRYVLQAIARAFLVAMAVLVSLFSLLDFVDQLHDVGHGLYRLIDAMRYIALTAPARAVQLAPVGMLFAGLLALGGMANNGELIGIRAAGVSLRRVLLWQLQLGLLLIVALFLLAEHVVPWCQRTAQFDRANRLAPGEIYRSDHGLWATRDHQFINVQRFADGVTPADIYIYGFDADGNPNRIIHAARARVLDDGDWLLDDVRVRNLEDGAIRGEHLASLRWPSFLRSDQFKMLLLSPENMAPTQLFGYVRDLHRHAQAAGRFDQALWSFVALPVTLLAMILITPRFLGGPARATSLGERVTSGVMLGLVIALIQQIAKQLGLLYGVPAPLSVGLPALLLLGASLALLRRVER